MVKNNIAVLVTGKIPDGYDVECLETLSEMIPEVFGDCDVYYQSWENENERFKNFPHKVHFTPVPEIDYSPFMNVYRPSLFSSKMIRKYQRHHYNNFDFHFNNQILQVMATAQLHELIEEEYDYYVRIRWDTIIRKDFDLNYWLKNYVDHGKVVGFGLDTGKFIAPRESTKTIVEYAVNRRKKLKDFFDSDNRPIEDVIITKDFHDDEYNTWKYFLRDFCIIYPKDAFDIDRFWKLHEDKKCWFAEFAWYQTLCHDREHVNVDRFALIQRHFDLDTERIKMMSDQFKSKLKEEKKNIMEKEVTKGFLIVASKKKFFYLSALNLIESIMDFYPEAKVCLVTEEHFLDDRGRKLADQIILCNDHSRAKIWGMARSPYDLTFYIDADTECEHEDIEKVFDLFNGHDILFTGLPAERHYCYAEVFFPGATKPDGTKAGFELCGGVCLYDMRKPLVRDFMHKWYDLTVKQYAGDWWPKDENGEEDLKNYPKSFKRWDQFSLWWLTNKEPKFKDLNIGIMEDDARWNYYSKYKAHLQHNKDPIVIRHYSSAGAKKEVY